MAAKKLWHVRLNLVLKALTSLSTVNDLYSGASMLSSNSQARTLILLHGMKRSGNHAFINWVNSDNSFFVLNNYLPKFRNLDTSKFVSAPRSLETAIMEARVKSVIRFGRNSLSNKVIVSLEDYKPSFNPFKDFESSGAISVYLVRRFRNLFSSRLRKFLATKGNPRYLPYSFEDTTILSENILIWKQYARKFLEFKQTPENQFTQHQVILFDSFVTSEGIRAAISKKLGLAKPPVMPPLELEMGGGSSFGNENWAPSDVLSRDSILTPQELEILDALWADPEIRFLDGELAKHT